MRHLLGVSTAIALLTAALSAVPASAAEPGPQAPAPAPAQVARGIIVQLADDARPSAVVAAADEALDATVDDGAEVVAKTPVSSDTTVLVTGDELRAGEAQDVAAALQARPDVEWAVPDYARRIATSSPVTPSDPRFKDQLNLWDPRDASHRDIKTMRMSSWPTGGFSSKAPSLWKYTGQRGSSDVVVAVVDTGITEHPDLAGAVLPGYDMISADEPGVYETARDGDGRDGDPTDPGDWVSQGQCGSQDGRPYPAQPSSWHGTHVAGIVAARADNGQGIAGVAPGVRVLPVRVVGACLGYDSDIIAGMRWAAGLPVPGAPTNTHPADVVNISLGGYATKCPSSYAAAISEVRQRGAVVVVAAGNETGPVQNSAPANCAEALTVTSTSEYGDLAGYANYGALVDLSAQGGDYAWNQRAIWSTVNEGAKGATSPGYAQYDGTSMAAPMVSGAVALVASLDPALTPSQLESAVKASVAPFPSSKNKTFWRCTTKMCGTGILDLSRVAVQPAPTATTAPSYTGTVAVGRTLTANVGTWTPAPTSYRYTWLADGKATGGTGRTYAVRAADVGRTLTVQVRATRVGTRTGSASSAGSKVAKASSTVTFSAPKKIKRSKKPTVKVRVSVPGVSRPTGTVRVYDGSKRIASAKLTASKKGSVSVKLPKRSKGRHTLKVVYTGSSSVSGATSGTRVLTVTK